MGERITRVRRIQLIRNHNVGTYTQDMHIDIVYITTAHRESGIIQRHTQREGEKHTSNNTAYADILSLFAVGGCLFRPCLMLVLR